MKISEYWLEAAISCESGLYLARAVKAEQRELTEPVTEPDWSGVNTIVEAERQRTGRQLIRVVERILEYKQSN